MAKIKTEKKNGKVYTYRNGKLFSIQPIKQTAAKSTPSGYGTSSRETASFVNSSVGVGSNRNRTGSVQHTNTQNAQKSKNTMRESKTGKVYKAGVGYQDRAAQSKTYNYGLSNIAKARKAEEAAKNQLKVAEDEQKKLVDRYGSDTAALEASIAGYSNRSDFEQNLDAANKKLSTAQDAFKNARNNRSLAERNNTLEKREEHNTFTQNKYADLMKRDKDAELYIKDGEQRSDSAKSFKDINKNDAWKMGRSFTAVGVSEEGDKNAAKVFMNDAERNQYNYLLGKFGKIEADNYYDAIYDDKVAPRFASYLADLVEADEKDSGIVAAGKTVGRSAQAFLTGAQEGVSGIGAAFRRMTGDTSIDSESVASMTHAEIASKLDGAEKIVNDVVYNVGHMMPTIVTSIATGGLGAPAVVSAIASSSSVGLSSFGNTYEEAIREGYSPDQATAYGILTGVSEGALQYALNGISKIAGGALTGKAAKAAQGAIKRVAKNPQAIKALNLILERSVDASGEFTEEYLQEVLDPVFKNIAYNESNEVKLVSEEALYSGLLGALTAGGMNAATDIQQTASRYLENSRSEKAFDNSYVRAGVQAAQNNPQEVRIQATPVLNKYAGRETVDSVLGRTYETNMPVLESLAGKDAVLRAGGEEIDKAYQNNLKVDTIWNKDYKANADRIAAKNGLSLSENNTENPKYDIIREQGGSTYGADILHEINNGGHSTRAGEQAQRMVESAESLEERRSFCDRIRGTDTVKRRAYETDEEKITLDVIEDISLPEALQKITDENKSMYGKSTYFFIDDAEVEIDGEMHSADGLRDENGDIWLSANAEDIYAINEHERFHILYAENVAAADVFANTVLGTLTPEEFDVLMDQYKVNYSFLDTDNAVYEEILADIYAGRIALKNSAAVTEAISKLNTDSVIYDDSGNVIPLYDGFNKGKNDIRYSLDDKGRISNFDIEIESIGRKWIKALVHGKKSTYHADILMDNLPDAKVGKRMTVPAVFIDKSTKYGKRFELEIKNESDVAAQNENNHIEEINRWREYVENAYKKGYLYKKGVDMLRNLGDTEYENRISEIQNELNEQKRKKEIERWFGYVENAYKEGRIYEKGIERLRELGASEYLERIEKMREDIRMQNEKKNSGKKRIVLSGNENRPARGEIILKNGKAYRVESVRYERYDGFSFGADTEDWYSVQAVDISDTEDGKSALDNARKAEEAAKAEQNKIQEVKSTLSSIRDIIENKSNYVKKGDIPSKDSVILYDTFNMYGSGERIVLDGDYVWYIRNNGMDGDAWDQNNYSTGGAGAIAYKVKRTELIDDKLKQISPELELAAIKKTPVPDNGIDTSLRNTTVPTRADLEKNPLVKGDAEKYIPKTESKQSTRQTLDEMARQYGTIKPGETPVRESNLPKKTSKDRFLSQFARTLYESGSTTEEMLPALESKLAAGDFSYEKIKNSKLASIAQKTVAEGMDSAQKIWDGVVENGATPKAVDIALGQTLYNEYVKNGDYDSAIKIASELAVEATRLGQSVQAFRLLKKLTPDGQLYVLERTKNNIKKELIKKMGDKAPDITIDETLAENLLRAKTPQEIESAVDAIKQNIADQMPATFADKLNAWRYLAMLGNPRTHIRNIVGNTIFIPMRALKDLIGVGLEKAVKVEQSKRTKTVLNPIKDKEYTDAGKKSFETVKDILQGTDKYGDRDIYNRRQIFKNRFLETARKLNSKALELEDVIFMKSAYVNSYAQAMKARGLTSETMTTKQESEISEYAIQEALKATYRDFNGLASALNRIKNSNKSTKIIGEGLMPFTTTPLNILKRGVEYSPVGVAKGVYEVLHDVKNGVKTPAEAIDTISSGLSGTAIMAVGVVLSALGLITSGGGDDEGEDALNKLTGGQNYAIEIGGHSYTIDWAAPTVLPLFIGVELERTLFEGNPGGSIKNILDSITKISDPLFNLSMLSSINSAIEAAKYSEGVPLTDIAINIATSYAGQFIPTVFGQFARIIDDTVRKTYYAKDSALPKAVDSFVQGAMKKIPGLNFLLQPSVDRWGREIKSGSIGERLAENLVSPGYYSQRNFTNVDVEIDRLYKQIGESAVIPPVPEKYFTVDGERKDLSASEYTQYSKLLGQGCYTAAEQTVNNPEYAKLSDREKSAAIQEAYNYAKQTAKSSISGYTVDNWVSELNKSGVNKGLYFSIKAKTSGIESNKDAQGNTIENSKSLKIKDIIDNTTSNEANKKKLYDLFGVNKKVASGYVTWDDANKPKLSNDNKTQIKQAAGYNIPEYKTETLENIQNIGVSVEDYAYIDDRIAAYGDKVGYIKSFGFNDKQTSGLVQSLVMGKSAKDKMRVANEEYGISNNDYIRTYMAGYSSVGSKSERNAQIRSFVDSLPGLTDGQKDILYEYNAVSRGKYDSEKEKSGSSGGKRSSGKRSSSRKKTVPNLSVPGVKNVSISKTRSDLVRSAMQNYMKQKQQSDLKAAYKAQLDEIDKNPFMTQNIRAAQKAKIKERFGIN